MANQIVKTIITLLIIFFFSTRSTEAENYVPKNVYLTNLNHINITNDFTRDLKQLKELIKLRKPKALYIEQWILLEPHNKNIIKKIHNITKKNNLKFYLVVGKNTWFGRRGVINTLPYFNAYEKYIDGIVLRVDPNKVNVWKTDESTKALILNYMLDAYSVLYQEAKNRNLQFIAEFPFWLGDFKGIQKAFPEDVCTYSSKISFLIDNPEMFDKLNSLGIKWNDVSCMYNINLTLRGTGLSEELLKEMYAKLKEKVTYYSNFNGFIVDSDSPLFEAENKG